MIAFDYIYYRIAKFFYKKDGEDAVRALGFVIIIQALLLLTLFFLLEFSISTVFHIERWSKLIGIALTVILGALNYFRYKNKYKLFQERWGQETENQALIRGALVLLAIGLTFALAIWTGTLAPLKSS